MRKLCVLSIGLFVASNSFVLGKSELEPEIIPEKAVVHVYRPSRIVGFGWNFKLKIQGKESTKVKNGKHLALEIEPGKTELKMKKNLIEMNLEPGKHYYIRTSLVRNMFLGKPEIVEVTKQQALKEIADL